MEYGLKVPGATYHTERRMSMNFLCKCCKSRVTESKRPEYIESAAIHQRAYHMEWAVFDEEENSKPINEREWSDRNIAPRVGDKRILRVKIPFDEEIGAVFTNVYEPWQMFLNGWDSATSPDDISKASAVLCRFEEVLWSDEFSAFISVEILSVMPLCQLYKYIPQIVTNNRFFEEFGSHEEVWTDYKDEHLLYRSWSAQGDVGETQLIYTDDNGKRHEVMTSWFGMHDDFYYFGNRVNE